MINQPVNTHREPIRALLIFLLIISMAMILTACGRKGDPVYGNASVITTSSVSFVTSSDSRPYVSLGLLAGSQVN